MVLQRRYLTVDAAAQFFWDFLYIMFCQASIFAYACVVVQQQDRWFEWIR